MAAYGVESLLQNVAATSVSGYALVNGTGTVISWTAPNDGALHRVLVNCQKHIASTETGGQITLSFTNPDGSTPSAAQIFAGGQSGTVNSFVTRFVQAGSTITLSQGSALTGGTSVLWADFWAS